MKIITITKEIKIMKTYKYKLQSKFPNAYKEIEEALEFYSDEHELNGYLYKNTYGDYNFPNIAKHVLKFVNKTFDHIEGKQNRIANVLQGLGLSIPYTYCDIYQLAKKDGQLNENDNDSKYQSVADNYWNFMAMILINVSEAK